MESRAVFVYSERTVNGLEYEKRMARYEQYAQGPDMRNT